MSDYKSTLNLPKTDFPMKANLTILEPQILQQWQSKGLYELIRKHRDGSPKYILHDGPPYANGDIHIGHALNKLLKDIVIKFKSMSGYDTPYVPGWDCHGLPVEHQLFKELNITKHQIERAKFRGMAKDYALKFVNIQREQFKRLGVMGDWQNPYLTLLPEYEWGIISTFNKLLETGYIYRGKKPVYWCTKCETALAEAEVEYADKCSPSIYVKFKVINYAGAPEIAKLGPVSAVIWTTTPWTLPSNMALAAHPQALYCLVKFQGSDEWLIVAEKLVNNLAEKIKLNFETHGVKFSGMQLKGMICEHPFLPERTSVVVNDQMVSMEEGVGIVHIAPGHGQEDYLVGLHNKLEILSPIDDLGNFTSEVKEFEGKNVYEANPLIIQKLKDLGRLLFKDEVVHSYPHCWRCKEPIVFRATHQWFLNLRHNNLLEDMLKAVDKVNWIPLAGKHRISGMFSNDRPDWCLSRQRYWGVPIPVIYCGNCKEPITDAAVLRQVEKQISEFGSDIWFIKDASEFLTQAFKCAKCGSDKFYKEQDILDVWFDSGVSFESVLKKRRELGFPADLYLEGSDQHRGWFQVSLINSVAVYKEPPYKNVLTHGFVVDGVGRKMSKSIGNVISPQEIIKSHGADILRLWVASSDYNEDIRVSPEILARLVEAYRKIRNTFRFILGNLYDFSPEKDLIEYNNLTEIDKWMLSKLSGLIKDVTKAYEEFSFHDIYHRIYNFCTIELSSFYLDILKDRLYTFKAASPERRSSQTAMYYAADVISKLTAPIMSFTAEEAHKFMPGKADSNSIFLANWPQPFKEWINTALEENWARLIDARAVVLKAVELKRATGLVGNSLEARVSLYCVDKKLGELLRTFKSALSEIFIVSDAVILDAPPAGPDLADDKLNLSVSVEKAIGQKCPRCWRWSQSSAPDYLCPRCAEAIA